MCQKKRIIDDDDLPDCVFPTKDLKVNLVRENTS